MQGQIWTNFILLQVTAIDRDIGRNGEVQYNLVDSAGDDGKFRVNRRTGEIIVKRPLEFEDQNKEYTLIIEAVDKGNYLTCCIFHHMQVE